MLGPAAGARRPPRCPAIVQDEIDNSEIDLLRGRDLECVGRPRGRLDVEPQEPELPSEGLHDRTVVVDDQDGAFTGHRTSVDVREMLMLGAARNRSGRTSTPSIDSCVINSTASSTGVTTSLRTTDVVGDCSARNEIA